jgi:hypothetical protein
MKRSPISAIVATVCALSLAGSSFAQDVKSLPNVTVTATTSTTDINSKVARIFESEFQNAVSPTWYKVNKNYLVYFITEDVNNKALYRKNGHMIYHFAYGFEKNLPEDVRNMVKEAYPKYEITSVINLREYDREVWMVNLQDYDKLLIAQVENGKMNIVTDLYRRH